MTPTIAGTDCAERIEACLLAFLSAPLNAFGMARATLQDDDYRLYVRRGRYPVGRVGSENALVIASIDVDPPGQGVLTVLLPRLLAMPISHLVFECVNNGRLAARLEREGFTHDDLRPNNWFRAVA